MHFLSKKASLLTLGITALALSRLSFVGMNDPEGTNLLVVAVVALLVYLPSLVVFSSTKRLWFAVLAQIVVIAAFYIFFH